MRLEKPTHSPEIADESLKAIILDEDYGVTASLPSFWINSDGNNGPPVIDPLTIYIHLPLAEDLAVDQPFLSLSLASLITYELDEAREFYEGSIEDEPRTFALRLRDRLRELADKIDEQVNSSP